jgi:hypothetical protein
MERKEQNPPGGPPQAAKGEDDQSSEEKRAMVALARILGAGPLVGGSLRLLEQLADYVQCPQEEVPREAGPVKRAAAQHTTSTERESAETAPAEAPTGEPNYSGDPEHITEEGVIVGSLRTMPTDRWTCKVPARGSSTASRTAGASTKWNQRRGSGWQICTVSAWGV